MKKRLLVLTSTYPVPNKDGEPRFVADLCQQFSSDYDVLVLTQSRPGAATTESDQGVKVRRYRYFFNQYESLSESGGLTGSIKQRPIRVLLLPLMLLSQFFAICKQIFLFKPQVVHAHWLIPQGFLVALASLLVFGRRPQIVCTSHGGDLYGLRDALSVAIKKWVARRVDVFCVVSSAMRNYAIEHLRIENRPVPICPMGADLSGRFVISQTRTRQTSELLFVGRLVEKKGVQYLLDALPRILTIVPNAHLTIVGDGPARPELQQKVEQLNLGDNVTFTGKLSHNQVLEHYQTSSVAVFPFVQAEDGDMEGLGLVMIEAMGCGCPVVAGDVPAVHDVITHNQTGLLCNPQNPASIADETLKLLSDQQLTGKMAERAREFAVQNYSWPVCADRYRDIFQRLSP